MGYLVHGLPINSALKVQQWEEQLLSSANHLRLLLRTASPLDLSLVGNLEYVISWHGLCNADYILGYLNSDWLENYLIDSTNFEFRPLNITD